MTKLLPKFLKNGSNEVLEGEGFYISYNPRSGGGFSDGGEETALCIKNQPNGNLLDGTLYLILKGDWRKQYLGAFPSLKKCEAIYDKNEAAYASAWTKK